MNYTISHVLSKAFKGRQWSIENDDLSRITYFDNGPKITKEEIEAADAKLFKEAQAVKYLEDRAAEYPSLEEKVNMICAAMMNGEIPACKALCEAMKSVDAKYPAPDEAAVASAVGVEL